MLRFVDRVEQAQELVRHRLRLDIRPQALQAGCHWIIGCAARPRRASAPAAPIPGFTHDAIFRIEQRTAMVVPEKICGTFVAAGGYRLRSTV
jgi:hypothetical protein